MKKSSVNILTIIGAFVALIVGICAIIIILLNKEDYEEPTFVGS